MFHARLDYILRQWNAQNKFTLLNHITADTDTEGDWLCRKFCGVVAEEMETVIYVLVFPAGSSTTAQFFGVLNYSISSRILQNSEDFLLLHWSLTWNLEKLKVLCISIVTENGTIEDFMQRWNIFKWEIITVTKQCIWKCRKSRGDGARAHWDTGKRLRNSSCISLSRRTRSLPRTDKKHVKATSEETKVISVLMKWRF